MSMNHFRNDRLIQLSQMVVNGEITHKIDQIATIYINGYQYFNVFRRYNSPYNIVLEDMSGDFHYHQDHTVRTSLKTVLCLNDYDAANIYTWSTTSFKHNGLIYSMPQDIADMRWTEIQSQYQAVSVNFRGIFETVNAYIPSTPIYQEVPEEYQEQQVQQVHQMQQEQQERQEDDEENVANILVTLYTQEPERVVTQKLFNDNVCYCNCESDDNEEQNDDEQDTIDENNYIVLRNGTMIPKMH